MVIGASLALAGCHPRPRPGVASPGAIALPAGSLAGIAGDGALAFAARASAGRGRIEAWRGAAAAWVTALDGVPGPLAVANGRLAVAVALADTDGQLVSLDAATGAGGPIVRLGASGGVTVTAIAGDDHGWLVAGSFAGSLRIGDRIAASAGGIDGFVARIEAGPAGPVAKVAWLRRLGGPGTDAVQGVASRGDRIAIAGTFSAGAELAGEALPIRDEHLATADGFVATLDLGGALRWRAAFGGQLDDAVAGVAIDRGGEVVVAATARGVVHVGPQELVVRGPADALVTWWSAAGEPTAARLIGGHDFDGAAAIAALDHGGVVVAGFYSGALDLGATHLVAGGGDDAFAVALDTSGAVVRGWSLGGEGREEPTAVAAIPGGAVIGVTHTAGVRLAGVALPAPADPMQGAALAIVAVP